MEVVSVPVSDIKVKFRLRTPSEVKIQGIAESITEVGLLSPITIDSSYNLLAGFHRLLAYKKLGKESIPSFIKEADPRFGQLVEVAENLARNSLSTLEESIHILKREQLLEELGLTYHSGDNQNTTKEDKLTIQELAEGTGYSKRNYQYRKQIAIGLNPEVSDLLVETEFADNLVDLLELSREPDNIQIEVANNLITGKSKTWKMAFYQAKLADFRLNSTPRLDFNVKERFGEYPKSLMKFNRCDDDLTKVINLVNHNEDLRVQKGSTNFGRSELKLHQMNPNQCLFSLDYYTQPNDLIFDPFQGRGTTAITSLYLQRRFIGFEINPTSYNNTKEVIRNNMNVSEDDWDIHLGCGCEMKELEGESEIIDAVFTSPPYYNHAEPYSDNPLDLCNMKVEEFDEKIDLMFSNLTRLVKKSDYKKKIFHPAIFVVGTARKGQDGILDMSFTFQAIAKKWGWKLWDQIFVELNNPHLCTSLQRNFELKFVQKNYESQLCFVRF